MVVVTGSIPVPPTIPPQDQSKDLSRHRQAAPSDGGVELRAVQQGRVVEIVARVVERGGRLAISDEQEAAGRIRRRSECLRRQSCVIDEGHEFAGVSHMRRHRIRNGGAGAPLNQDLRTHGAQECTDFMDFGSR